MAARRRFCDGSISVNVQGSKLYTCTKYQHNETWLSYTMLSTKYFRQRICWISSCEQLKTNSRWCAHVGLIISIYQHNISVSWLYFLSASDSLQLQWGGLSTRGTSHLVLPNTDLRTSQVVLTGGLVVIHADPVQLQVAVSVVGSCWVDAVLIADHLPELNTQTHKHSEGTECWNDVI